MIVAFTGHRPDKLGGYKLPNPTYIKICQKLDKVLRELKPSKALSGMALGIDQWAANVCVKLEIPFVAVIPFVGQEKMWPADSQRIYNNLLTKAAEKVIVSEGGYSAAKMQIRNQYLVDNCDLLIAVYNGDKTGGTANCINYAKEIGKKILIIDPT